MVISLLQNSDTRKPGRYPIDPRETLYLNEYIQRVNYKNMRTPDLPTCPTQASVYIAVYMCRVFFFFVVRMLPSNVGTYLVCVASSCVIYCKCVPGAGLRTPDLPTCPTQAIVYIAVYMCRVFLFFFVVRMLPSNVGTYLVCVASSCVIYCRCVPPTADSWTSSSWTESSGRRPPPPTTMTRGASSSCCRVLVMNGLPRRTGSSS